MYRCFIHTTSVPKQFLISQLTQDLIISKIRRTVCHWVILGATSPSQQYINNVNKKWYLLPIKRQCWVGLRCLCEILICVIPVRCKNLDGAHAGTRSKATVWQDKQATINKWWAMVWREVSKHINSLCISIPQVVDSQMQYVSNIIKVVKN